MIVKADPACFPFRVLDNWSHRWGACRQIYRMSRSRLRWSVNLKPVLLITGKELASLFICQIYLGQSLPDAQHYQRVNNAFILSKFVRNAPSHRATTQNFICSLICDCQIVANHVYRTNINRFTGGFTGDEGFIKLYSVFSLSRRVGPVDKSKSYRRFVEVALDLTI